MSDPKHVGIILDGNRRFAKQKGFTSIKGHKTGAETLTKILPFFAKTSVTTLTLYVFSVENFKRSQEEVNDLFELVISYCDSKKFLDELHKNETRVNFVGDLSLFPENISKRTLDVEKKTKNYTKRLINLAFGYGGRQEILRAVRDIAQDVQESKIGIENITEEVFAQYLYVNDDPDLIIRTGGQVRTSNFLPWQSVYSEWFFIPKFWPQITESDLQKVLDDFSTRKRNFGK